MGQCIVKRPIKVTAQLPWLPLSRWIQQDPGEILQSVKNCIEDVAKQCSSKGIKLDSIKGTNLPPDGGQNKTVIIRYGST